MREDLKMISNDYVIETKNLTRIANGKHEIVTKAILKSVPDFIKDLSFIDSRYKLKGSKAQGNLPKCAYIAIMNTSITDKVSEGYYVVYLFSYNTSKIFLSLNQAWTPYKGKGKILRKDMK